jgi:hypothetical protein
MNTQAGAGSVSVLCMAMIVATGVARAAMAADIQVNTYTSWYQTQPIVAMDGAAGFVVVWYSDGQDGYGGGLFGQRFSAAGARVASEFQVNLTTAGQQADFDLAIDDAGDFVVAWGSNPFDGNSYGVAVRRFDSAGAPQGGEIQANTYISGLQRLPVVGMDGGGAFVVVWNSTGQDGYFSGLFGQRFDSAGVRIGGEFQIATYTAGQEQGQAIAIQPGGGFLVAWSSAHDGDSEGVFARLFGSSGAAIGAEFQVNTYTPSGQAAPSVATDGDGDFVVAWQSYLQDGAGNGVFAQRLTAAGSRVGGEFQVNVRTTGAQQTADVARNDAGGFVVAWSSEGQDGSGGGVFVRRFNAAGTAVTSELQMNEFTAGNQVDPSIGISDGGEFVVAWTSYNQDGEGGGVFARRVTNPAVLDVDANGTIGPLTDGLLILRYMFGFSGTVLTSGAVGPGCLRCDATSISNYLGGLV